MDLMTAAWFAALAAAIVLYSLSLRQGGRTWWLLALAVAVLVVSAVAVGHSWLATLLLCAAELAAAALIAVEGTQGAKDAARKYLTAIVPAIACTLVAAAIGGTDPTPDSPAARLMVGLLIVGFGLRLGLVPFSFWLPEVAAHASVMSAAIVVSLVDVAAFSELAALRAEAPWIFQAYAPVWLGLAVLSMGGGALLALAQTQLRRMLAFSSVGGLGLLVLGLVAGGAGFTGAWLGALNVALAKLILFGAVGIAEQRTGQTITLGTRGLGKAMPLASAAFVVGAFGLLGVPPGFGFVGSWRLYAAAADLGGPVLLAFVLAVAGVDLLCYARAIHRTWFGAQPVALAPHQPALLAGGVLAGLAVAEVLLGCWPALLTAAATPFGALH